MTLFGRYRIAFVGPSETRPGHLKYSIFVDGNHEGYKVFPSPAAAVEWLQNQNKGDHQP